MRGLAVAVTVLLACGPTTTEPPLAKAAPTKPEAATPAPGIVQLPLGYKEHDDCAAQGPKQGVLDWASATYRRIEVKQGKQSIEEKAFLRKSDLVVTVSIGGCAHYGASYTVTYADSKGAEELAHHLGRALEAVKALAFRDGATTHLDSIAPLIEKNIGSIQGDGDCHYPDGEMTNISCDVSTIPSGRTSVRLMMDIVL